MKKKIEIVFSIHYDYGTGDCGFLHKGSENLFDPFYNNIGIFHDVFEHHHEDTHKYFKGSYAFNVAGEMMASGAMYYYSQELSVYNRRIDNFRAWGYVVIESGYQEFIDLLAGYGTYGNFGCTLESIVPYQKPVYPLESDIQEGWLKIRSYKPSGKEDLYDYDAAIECRKSITKRKFFDLYRYGFRYAQRFVPDNWENRETLIEFINFWNDITKKVDVEELYSWVDSIQFNISKSKDIISCKAYLILRSGKKKRIRSLNDFGPYDVLLDDY